MEQVNRQKESRVGEGRGRGGDGEKVVCACGVLANGSHMGGRRRWRGGGEIKKRKLCCEDRQCDTHLQGGHKRT